MVARKMMTGLIYSSPRLAIDDMNVAINFTSPAVCGTVKQDDPKDNGKLNQEFTDFSYNSPRMAIDDMNVAINDRATGMGDIDLPAMRKSSVVLFSLMPQQNPMARDTTIVSMNTMQSMTLKYTADMMFHCLAELKGF